MLVQLKHVTAIHLKISDIIFFLNCAFTGIFMRFSMGKKNNEYKKNVVKLFEELKIKNKICPPAS